MTIQQKTFSIRFFYAILLTLLMKAEAPGTARTEVPDPSIMLPLVSAAAEADAPPIIKPGTRLIYFGMTASIPGAYGKLVQDDNGNWIDKNTGQKYREEQITGNGAAAYNVIQVGFIGNKIAQLSNKIYTLDITTRKCMYGTSDGIVTHAGCAADYWIHPNVLRDVKEVNADGMRILRMPYTVAGKTYKAIRFQRDDISGYQARVYDLETGLLIFYALRVQGPSVITPPSGLFNTPGTGEGSTQISTGWIVEIKDIDVPWKAAPMPKWVSEFKQLSFRGVQTSIVAAANTKLNRNMVVTLTPKARGTGWLRFRNDAVIDSLPGMPPEKAQQEGSCGSASIGGLWISPEELVKLRPQQLIERNELVGTTTTVTQAGADSVTLSETGPLHKISCTYNTKTGILTATTTSQQIGLAEIIQNLKLTSQN
ncbi:MAG: hypothetical protein JW787_08830 [Sedimentisphaerales bacterium]|nr:hypothetical protein [Sedimentisphaerales bacterium]